MANKEQKQEGDNRPTINFSEPLVQPPITPQNFPKDFLGIQSRETNGKRLYTVRIESTVRLSEYLAAFKQLTPREIHALFGALNADHSLAELKDLYKNNMDAALGGDIIPRESVDALQYVPQTITVEASDGMIVGHTSIVGVQNVIRTTAFYEALLENLYPDNDFAWGDILDRFASENQAYIQAQASRMMPRLGFPSDAARFS